METPQQREHDAERATESDFTALSELGFFSGKRAVRPAAPKTEVVVEKHGHYRGKYRVHSVVLGPCAHKRSTVIVPYNKSFRHFPFGEVSIVSAKKL